MQARQTQITFDGELAKRIPEFKAFEGKRVQIKIEEIAERKDRKPVFGAGKDHVRLKEGWDAPIDDFEDYV